MIKKVLNKIKDKLFPSGTTRRKRARRVYLLIKHFFLILLWPYYKIKIREFIKNRSILSRNDSGTLFSLDNINEYRFANLSKNVNVIQKKGSFFLGGWAVDSCSVDLAGWIFIQIDGKLFRAGYKQDRPDVSKAFNNPNYRFSGFSCVINTVKLSVGLHEVKLLVVSKSCSEYFELSTGIKLFVSTDSQTGFLNIGPVESWRIKKYIEYFEKKEAFYRPINFFKVLELIEKCCKIFKADKNFSGDYKIYTLKSVKQYCKTHNLLYRKKIDSQNTTVYEPRYYSDNKSNYKITVKQPEIYIAELNNVFITGESSVIISNDNYAFFDMGLNPETKRYNFRDGVLRYADSGYAIIKISDENESFIEKGIMISGTASRNYFHWLFEFITRLSLLSDDTQYSGFPLIVDEAVLAIPQMADVLKIYSGGREIISIVQNTKYRIKTLVVPSYLTWIPLNIRKNSIIKSTDAIISAQGVNYLRDRMKVAVEENGIKNEKRKVFISRKSVKTLYRVLLNEEEIVQIFKDYGFDIIYPESMSFREQYECFSKATVIAGASGAGMTNIVFAPKDCQIICLINKRIDFSGYSTIAGIIGQKMIFIEGEIDPHINNVNIKYQSSFKINIEKLVQYLEMSCS